MEGCYEQGRTSSRSSPDGGGEGAIMAVFVDAVMKEPETIKEPETTPSTTTASSCSGSESHAPAIPTQPSPQATTKKSKDIKLAIAFVSMVLVATGLSVMGKLVAIPLYNYPNFLNLFSLLIYVILCFAYIFSVPSSVITAEQTQVPKRTFAIFGFLDTLSTSIQTFSTCYLSGPLLIMLPQAAIPFSMIFSRTMKGERFHAYQYVGAVVVVLGIVVVLEPMFSHRRAPDYICQTNEQIFDPDEFCTLCRVEMTQESCYSHTITTNNTTTGSSNSTTSLVCEWIAHDPTSDTAAATEERNTILWSLVVIVSCIPMTLSSLYKEMTLDRVELDPLYLNGWTALFQTGYSLIMAVPAGMLFSPPVHPTELPGHLQDAWQCYYYGKGAIDTGCHPDDLCGQAFWLFNLNFVLVCMFTVLSVYMLKYGSTSLLFLAFTIQVPLGNLVFCLPFMPGYAPMHVSDIVGLIVIVTGLILYRSMMEKEEPEQQDGSTTPATTTTTSGDDDSLVDSLQEPLLLQSQLEPGGADHHTNR